MTTILQRIAAGDETAVAACLDEYGDLVWRLAMRYLDRASSDAEDAVQEVFVEIWISASRFDPGKGTEPAFVATIAHRRLTDYQRRIVSRARTARGHAMERKSDLASQAVPTPKTGAADTVIEAMSHLPAEENHALLLWLYRGMTQRQISEATASPIGTVKSRVRRGLLKIRDAIGQNTGQGTGQLADSHAASGEKGGDS